MNDTSERSGPLRVAGADWGEPDEEERPTPSPRPAPSVRPAPRRPTTREQLRAAVASPGALRRAFLVHQVLGPPVSLRDDQGHVPR